MMTAKTVLLAKVQTPMSINHARPITILSCLYRLLGKFVFKVTANVWKDIFPYDVSGGLPGRGVKELAFAQKRIIEQAISEGSCLGGFSLDLVKAFNTFGRYPVGCVMQRLGIPKELIQAWISSLDHMVRYPTLQGCVSTGIHSTTGVPEGCSISVLAMLAISRLFHGLLANDSVRPFTYADNWSWMSRIQKQHFAAHTKMLALTSSMRLMIDHSKSWHWGTKKDFREACKFAELMHPDGSITAVVRTSVKDLGEKVAYNKCAALGFIKDKIDEAVSRLHRLEWLQASLQTKAKIIQTTVWPLALYSSDTTYVGLQHYVALRRAAVSCLIGKWHNASPIICCAFISKFLCDPFLYTLLQAVRTLRRISTICPDLAKKTVVEAVQWKGSRPFGPASALKQYIKNAGWTLHEDGLLQGPDYLSCNVLKDPCRRITKVLRLMWNHNVLEMTDRKGVGDHIPDAAILHSVFHQFTEADQNILKMNVVGGFQTNSQKAKWDEDTSDQCPLCKEKDTREHRLLGCAPLQQIRDNFPDACSVLDQKRPEWVYVPLPRLHNEVVVLRAFLQTVKFPQIPLPKVSDNHVYKFYTDGGSKQPRHMQARIATWAVVQDISNDDDHRKMAADFLFTDEPRFPLFHVSAVGIVPGDQTVARAELFAVLIVVLMLQKCGNRPHAEIVTDASYVRNVIEIIEHDHFRPILHRLSNCDLIVLLAQHWDKDRYKVTKVKSHRNLSDADSLPDLWNIAGNMCADTAVASAYNAIPQDIRALSEQIAKFAIDELCCLKKHFQFLVEHNKMRLSLVSDKLKEDNNGPSVCPKMSRHRTDGLFDPAASGIHALDAMINFSPDGYTCRPAIDVEDEKFHLCMQGANIAKSFKMWCELLQWPTDVSSDYDAMQHGDWGISWFELLINFYLCTGWRCPIKTGGTGGQSTYINYDDAQALLMPDGKRAASLQVLCLRNLVQSVTTILQTDIFLFFIQTSAIPCIAWALRALWQGYLADRNCQIRISP